MGRMDRWVSITDRFFRWREGLGDGAGGVASLIAERPVSIVIVRQDPVTHAKTTLAAQTVRVDLDARLTAPLAYGKTPSASVTNAQRVIVLGYKNLEFVDDTDLALMDSFKYDDQQFRITKIEMGFTDRIIAEAEAEG